MAFFLSTYIVHRFNVPLGWDTPGYVWHADYARSYGLNHLPATIPLPGPANPGRPAFSVLANLAMSIVRTKPYPVAEALPADLAAASALAAGALVSVVLRASVRALALTAAFVGTSAFLLHVINVEQYQDNVIAMAIFMAAASPLIICAWDRRAAIPAVLLMIALALTHWSFFELAALILLIVTAIEVLACIFSPRSGLTRPTPGRLITLPLVFVSSFAISLLCFVAFLGIRPPSPMLVAAEFASKLQRDLPAYHLPYVLIGAALGAAWLWRVQSRSLDAGLVIRYRAFLIFTAAWSEVVLLAYGAQNVLGWAVPTHRVLAFDLAIPILGVLGALWAARQVACLWRPLRPTLIAVLLLASTWVGIHEWFSFHPVMSGNELRQAAISSAYLESSRVPDHRFVVFIVDDHRPTAWSRVWLQAHVIRAALGAARIRSTFLYVGSWESYLARRPSSLQSFTSGSIAPQRYADLSSYYFAGMAGTYARDPVAILIGETNPEFSRWAAANPQAVLGPGVGLLNGPPARSTSSLVGQEEWIIGRGELIRVAICTLLMISVAGSGWAFALMRRWARPFEVVALSPAVGAAVLVIGAVVLNRIGLPLRGAGAISIFLLVACGGWVAAAARLPARADPLCLRPGEGEVGPGRSRILRRQRPGLGH